MQNVTLIHHYPRQPNVTIVIVTNKGDKFDMDHARNVMALYSTGAGTVLEVVRYADAKSEDIVGTLHFPNPSVIELTGNKK